MCSCVEEYISQVVLGLDFQIDVGFNKINSKVICKVEIEHHQSIHLVAPVLLASIIKEPFGFTPELYQNCFVVKTLVS